LLNTSINLHHAHLRQAALIIFFLILDGFRLLLLRGHLLGPRLLSKRLVIIFSIPGSGLASLLWARGGCFAILAALRWKWNTMSFQKTLVTFGTEKVLARISGQYQDLAS